MQLPMRFSFVNSVPFFPAFLFLALFPIPARSQGEAPAPAVCDTVRVFPRADQAARMTGGEIQGSNESATGGFVTLAKLALTPTEGHWSEIKLESKKAFRFLRYFGPENSFTNVAELEFLSGGKKIAGKTYGTFGSRDNSGNDYSKAFDGDTTTFFDAVTANAQYLGIDLGGAATTPTAAPVTGGKGLRSYHIGNSLTDGMGEYTRELAIAAGFVGHFMDRQTIPGSPLYLNYQSDSGFGTPYREAFEKFAPLSDLVMQTFISNGDSESPEFSLKFYDDARVKSPAIRPWIYGQWEDLGSNKLNPASPLWEQRNRALMRIYIAHSLNFNALTKDQKSEVIPGGLALLNLKNAFDAEKVPGLTDFFATNFSDDLHLTENGRQFIGMVIFATLYDQSPVGLPVVKINDIGPTLTSDQNKVYQEVAWETVQSFRKDRGASLGFPVPGEIDARVFIGSNIPLRGSRVGNIDADRSFIYVLNADRAGKYDFKVSATTDKADMRLDVFVNHEAVGSVTIHPHKDQPAADSLMIPIDLAAGVNLLRILVPFNRSYDLNSIKITRADAPLLNQMPIFDLSAWEEEIRPGASLTRDFRVFDFETPVADLVMTAASDQPALIPDSALKIESGEFKGEYGNVYSRRLTVTPVAGKTGEANVILTLADAGGAKRVQSLKVKIK